MWLLSNADPHQDNDDSDVKCTVWTCRQCPLAGENICSQKSFRKAVQPSYISREKVSSLLYIITKCSCDRHCVSFFHNKRE